MNYTSSFRTNYFLVRDPILFTAFCADYGLTATPLDPDDYPTQSCLPIPSHTPYWGIFDENNGIPDQQEHPDGEEWIQADFLKELATHLLPGSVCVLMETGQEGLRYLVGRALALNHTGEVISLELEDIYPMAKPLGVVITPCSY